MMNFDAMFSPTATDADLVAQSLAGNRDAYGAIVARYQNLICSLAYSATGSLCQSQDLAQEVFVDGWKDLARLREPGKLRSWLCSIARNRISDTLRRQGREPSHAAKELESAYDLAAAEPLPLEQTITKEEEAILWRYIEKIPETYREPLILFYREHQSIEKVAESLDLTEEAVRQRLSRGRKLLQEQVLAFLQGALERTSPGKHFTLAVVAALPLLTTSAKAATIAAGAAKGSAVAKASGLLAALNAILGPVVFFLAGYLGYKLEMESAQSPEAKALVARFYRMLTGLAGAFFVAIVLLIFPGSTLLKEHPLTYIALFGGLGLVYAVLAVGLTLWMRHKVRAMHNRGTLQSRLTPAYEYQSKSRFLGIPLVHVRIRGGIERGPVKAWIAIGDAAIGGLLAFGGFAIAPVSIGGIAIGLAPFGGLALGLAALGGFATGVWAIGGFAAGWHAFGGFAMAWQAAMGGVAVAREVAMGAVAHAAHVNNALAEDQINAMPFFDYAQTITRHLGWINLIWVVALFFWLRGLRARKKVN